ncbi:MAG: alkaline phosphatase family protein [Candidatus Binataceae bacterium]
MADIRNLLDNIFIVIMENRSFDHALGYLSLPTYNVRENPPHSRIDIEGIRQAWRDGYLNRYSGIDYPPWHRTDLAIAVDPPHERLDVSVQMGSPEAPFPMNGFVESYASNANVAAADCGDVMGFYTSAELPVSDFLARNFGICDHWFSAIPASTQPNRLMAMSGYTMRDKTLDWPPFAEQDLVYDWLDHNRISWRVYHEGFPFFMLMPRIAARVLDPLDNHFRDFRDLKRDWLMDKDFPKVVFIEPIYTDALHLDTPDDDHPSTPVAHGQQFLWKIYDAIIANAERWCRSALIITYDENGGFFDHVQPLTQATVQNHNEEYKPFKTTGVRVPAIVVSPLVDPGTVFHQNFDHTSLLRLLADRFTPGQAYSAEVSARKKIDSAVELFARDTPVLDLARPPAYPIQPAAVPRVVPENAMRPNQLAFRNALNEIRRQNPYAAATKFPSWRDYFLK